MFKMSKVVVIGTIVALLIATIGITAWAGGGGGRFFHGGGKGGFLKGLNLTADQQSKILTIQQGFQKDTLSLRQDLQKKNMELRQLWNADQLNQSAIDAKNHEITTLQIQMVQKSRTMMDQVKKLLTADQLKQFENFQGKGGPGFGPGRMGFGGMGMMKGGFDGAAGATGA